MPRPTRIFTGTRRLTRMAALAVALVGAPALACTCIGSRADLLTQMKTAFDGATHVLLARVVEDSGDSDTATLEVLEVFKGPLSAGKRIKVEAGSGSMCLFRFFRDQDWLIYSNGRAVDVHLCTRSRVVRGADAELDWLRTRKAPPVPVALQRGRATCTGCGLDAVAATLTGTATAVDLAAGLAGRAPFRAEAAYAAGVETVVGRAKDGRLFELRERLDYPYELCTRRIVRRWCDGLSVKTRERDSGCVRPGLEEVVCDEAAARQVTWAPRESMAGVDCRWREPSRPICELPLVVERATHSDAGVPNGPTLKCLPRIDDTDGQGCWVE